MSFAFYTALSAVVLALGALMAIEIGRRQGLRHIGLKGVSALEGAVFGLMGLLLAFTFSGAAERFDARRRLVIEEANAIGTAYLRVDLVPAAVQPPVREAFRRYVEARLEIYRRLPDMVNARAELARAEALQARIWALMVPASYDAKSPAATMLIVNALNTMFDVANARTSASRIHPPFAIYLLLAVSTLVSALLAGFTMGANRAKSWVHLSAFAVMLAVTLYVIFDLEYPRVGLIRMDSFDEVLRHEREVMK